MRGLRTTAFVMLGIAAFDAAVDGVEFLIERYTTTSNANLWPVLLGTGIALMVADVLIEHRTEIGRTVRRMTARIARKA